MRVICKANLSAQLPESYQRFYYHREHKFPLIVGESYIVYGMILWMNHIHYLILGESEQSPAWVPAALFEIIDSKLSRHWHFGPSSDHLDTTVDFIWGYEELVDSPNHFDALVEGDREALDAFRRYKAAMDLELFDPACSGVAQVLDVGWLLCPKCGEAWESEPSSDALVQCPMCQGVSRNPNQI